jgi:putative nucleotidyltransferase with HDIG domain
MLKRVRVSDLRLGMFVQEFCGSWLDHPFWRSSFELIDPQDLVRIRASRVREAVIDTRRGLDVVSSGSAVDAPDGGKQIEALSDALPDTAVRVSVPRVSFEDECMRARNVLKNAKGVVTSVFQEARMGRVLEMTAVMGVVEIITASVARNQSSLISLARLKSADEYTYMHSVAVCSLMVALAHELGFDAEATRKAGLAGLLHDVGKAVIPLEVLNKPGKLTNAEFDLVKQHPRAGADILKKSCDVDAVALDVCLHHHEKMDGRGYPESVGSEKLSLYARMGAVCDIYDAVTSNRPYKDGWDPAVSLRRMSEWTPDHLDRAVFHAFVKCVGIYPIGSLVRLQSARIGVVVEQNPEASLAPKVKAFYSIGSKSRIKPEVIDLSHVSCKDRIENVEMRERWDFPDLDAMWAG